MAGFGRFDGLCRITSSYPWCNLFYRQLQRVDPNALTGVSKDPNTAPVGIDPTCGIPRTGPGGSLGNIANIVVCALSFWLVVGLLFRCNRRKEAVGRLEFRTFLILYLISLPLQLLTTGSFLKQGSNTLVVFTAFHAGVVVALFWSLLANAIVATQVVNDGTLVTMIPLYAFSVILFGGTVYISLDVALGVTTTIGGPSSPPSAIKSIPLFVLTSIWPALSALMFMIIMSHITVNVLNVRRPMVLYVFTTIFFIVAQLLWFLLGTVICFGSARKVDGSFVATLLETVCVWVLYLAWKSITEDAWDNV